MKREIERLRDIERELWDFRWDLEPPSNLASKLANAISYIADALEKLDSREQSQ